MDGKLAISDRYWRTIIKPSIAALFTLTIVVAALLPRHLQAQGYPNQWPMGGHDLSDSWSQPFERAIGPSNVNELTTKWVFTTGGDVSATPAVVRDVVYFPDWAGNFYAVDANTGLLIWSHKISDWTGISGDLARNDPAFDGNAAFLGDQGGGLATFSVSSGLSGPGARVMSVDAHTGNLNWVTQVDSFPGALITSSPVVFNSVVYVGVSSSEEGLATDSSYPCCSFRGSIVALSRTSGQILWKTYVMPLSPGNPGGYSGGAVWNRTPVVDVVRGSLYVGTGNNYTVPSDVKTCIAANAPNDSACDSVDNYAKDYFDSVLSLDLKTGAIKWADRVEGYDAWTVACLFLPPGVAWCPSPAGPDYDFGGAGPNLFTTTISGQKHDVVGEGQKSGIYWAFDPDTGNPLWNTLVGPGSTLGGIEWGTATDGQRVYVPIANVAGTPYTLEPSGTRANGGSWSALDPATGKILWQTATPGRCTSSLGATVGCMGLGPATVANGVVYVASMDKNPSDPTMFALDAATGAILWSFSAGSSVNAAPAVVGNSIYWGSGYGRFGPGIGTGNNKLYAFMLPAS